MQESRVRSLAQEDALEKGMAIHSSILAWRIPSTEEPGGLQSTWSQELATTERLNFHHHFKHPCGTAEHWNSQLKFMRNVSLIKFINSHILSVQFNGF